MYENFSAYWEAKKEVLEKLGVSMSVAKMIWCDAVDSLAVRLKIEFKKKATNS